MSFTRSSLGPYNTNGYAPGANYYHRAQGNTLAEQIPDLPPLQQRVIRMISWGYDPTEIAARTMLNQNEIAALEQPYTPRYDFQAISDEAELQKIRDQIPGYANA